MGNGKAPAAAPTPVTFCCCCCCFKKFKVLFCAGAKDCTQIQECSSAPGSLVSGLALIVHEEQHQGSVKGRKKKNSPTFTLPHTQAHTVSVRASKTHVSAAGPDGLHPALNGDTRLSCAHARTRTRASAVVSAPEH